MPIGAITNAGLAAAVQSEASGYTVKINIASYKIGTTVNTAVTGAETDVLGTVVDTGTLSNMTVTKVGDSILVYKIRLDTTKGDFDIGNVGLFTDTGTLFALLVFPRVRPKVAAAPPSEAGNIIELQFGLVLSNLVSAVNLTLTTLTEADLPTVATSGALPAAGSAPHNMYIVQSYATGGPAFAYTNGSTWTYLPFSTITLTAAGVTNAPSGGISGTTVQAALNELDTEKANIASPTFTGVPTAPTAAGGTNTTQIATTAFVTNAVSGFQPTHGTLTNLIADGAAGANGDVFSIASVAAGVVTWTRNTTSSLFRSLFNLSTTIAMQGAIGTRIRRSTGLILYVNASTGNDTTAAVVTNGVMAGESAATPFLTIGAAAAAACDAFDNAGFIPTIKVATGTYTRLNWSRNPVGAAYLYIEGDTTTPSNVLISDSAGAAAIQANQNGTVLLVSGIKVAHSAANGFLANAGGKVIVGTAVDFGACAAAHMQALDRGEIRSVGAAYTITGNATNHIMANHGNVVWYSNAVTIAAARAFTTFVSISGMSAVKGQSNTFSGAGVAGTTGTRYSVTGNSSFDTGGAGANYLPGSIAGSAEAATYSTYI